MEQPVLAVDGKTARRSHDRKNGLGALHSVSVWASEFGLSLGQVACAEKSNEITAIPELLQAGGHQGGHHHDRRDGDAEGDRRADHRGRGRLRPGVEGEPGDVAPGGHRPHPRAVGGRLRGREGPSASDRGDGARPRGDADLHPDAGARGPAGAGAVGGPEVDRRGGVGVRPRRQGDGRGPLLHQQPGGGREAVRPRRPQSIGASRTAAIGAST